MISCILIGELSKTVNAQEMPSEYKIVEDIVLAEIGNGYKEFYSIEDYSTNIMSAEKI